MSESNGLSDGVKAVAESFLIDGVHPNLRLVAEAALQAARLESENQAIQEALEQAEQNIAMRQRHHNEEDLPEIKALQERIEEARKYVTEHGLAMMNTPATWHRFVTTILELLSPTQETDRPETFCIHGKRRGYERTCDTCPPWPTQETDPE